MLEWRERRMPLHHWGEFQILAFHVAPSMGSIVSRGWVGGWVGGEGQLDGVDGKSEAG